jgi:hypothetical protein
MTPQHLKINASTKEDRHHVITQVREAITNCGGYILDHQMFSNISICLQFELPRQMIGQLSSFLSEFNLRLSEQSKVQLSTHTDPQNALNPSTIETVAGSMQITFIHNEPDWRITIPPIPG